MHLGVRAPGQALPELAGGNRLARRADTKTISTIVVLGVVISVVFLSFLWFCLRTIRARHKTPKYIPTAFLKRLWKEWKVGSYSSAYQPAAGHDSADTGSNRNHLRPTQTNSTAADTLTQSQSNTTAGVDRNTSIRSIMTLPVYRPRPSNTEQVLGREGERDGIDMVVEQPTAEDLEALREDEMETLYNIRLARRQEIAEREERRRLRRDARERNDIVALEDLRTRARAASNNTLVDELRVEHQRIKDQRQRAVSSVSYADLGIARHDGTRIRANSTESERVGLLSDAASFAASSTRSGVPSTMRSGRHRRERSASSVVSFDSDMPSPGLTRSRANSRPETPRLATGRAGSSPEIIEADLGDADMPPHSPPGYEDVSLEDVRSATATPQNEPPPDYPGPFHVPESDAARQDNHLAVANDEGQARGQPETSSRRLSRGVGGVPQLPSLRLNRLPQIVIEPSSARPRDDP